MKASSTHIEGYGKNIPPAIKHVHIYFLQNGLEVKDADVFLKKMAKQKWRTKKGHPCHNWKAYAFRWILRNKIKPEPSVYTPIC
jgi:hypothetical protein